MEGKVSQHTPSFFSITGIRYRGDNYLKLSAFPDTSAFRNGIFLFKPSHSNLTYAVENFPNMEWTPEAKAVLEEMVLFKIDEANKQTIKDSHLQQSEAMADADLKSKTKPFKHQSQAFSISKNMKEYALFFEQGCGKTKVIIDTARYLFDSGMIDTLIVVAPNGVHDNWVDDELPIHMFGDYQAIAWRSSFNKTQKAIWDKIKQLKSVLKIFTFNVETFASMKGKTEIIDILKNNKCMLAVDESQTIKNPSAKRTKFLTGISPAANYRRILTGTPITKGAEDFYSQLKFLNPNIIGISAYSGFKNRYCVMGGFEYRQIVGYRNIEELQRKVQNHSMRVLKKDCLDLPDKIYQFAPFDLTEAQNKMIKQIKDEGLAEIAENKESKAIIMEHVMTRLTKIQQISRGYLYDTENSNIIEIVGAKDNPALRKLKELLASMEGKVIIWTKYTHDIKIISTVLPKDSFLVYDGSVDQDQRKENKKEFQQGDKYKYFLINIQTGAKGLTLTAAEHNIYFNGTYDLELRLQSEDRTHRIGTVNNVNYVDMIANKTGDKKIITALKKKKTISDIVLQDPTSLFLTEGE